MKNLVSILAVALTLGLTQTSNAQDNMTSKTSDVKFGIKGGVNFSNMYTDDVDDENVLTGFTLGLFAKAPITNFIALQPELNFTTKGSELTYNNAFAQGKAKFRMDYIEVPLLLVVNVTKNFNIHGGPYLAYLIHSSVKNDSDVNSFDFENTLNNDDFNRFDAGLSGGLGFDFDMLSFGARYNYGLTTVGKERNFDGTNYTFPDGKNSVLNFYVGLSF
ncbi:MAG: porin family protein [Flavobacterium sp.]